MDQAPRLSVTPEIRDLAVGGQGSNTYPGFVRGAATGWRSEGGLEGVTAASPATQDTTHTQHQQYAVGKSAPKNLDYRES